eukprot:TRINITY_DN2523_c0_g2_i1.p2 TRINITY_DN2523_c0_g2~~TRINITY_DN2523_c0_g2_i1.p2  ORF type:complete len:127 (+),score=24.30 TRINITY_DN2523_c0_g2_i1:490-870(+)
MKEPVSKQSIDQVGSMEDFIKDRAYIMGQQIFSMPTDSEGGFKSGKVSSASILDMDATTDRKGNKYYTYELLTRTADNTEGGRHMLVKAGVKNGNLYLMKVESGDKRWIRNQRRNCQQAFESFQLV